MSRAGLQQGVTTVEFAIIGAIVMIVLFGVIEVGRTVFSLHTLSETTRRATRFATVCPVNDPAIREVALFNAPGDASGNSLLSGFSAENIAIEYLDRSGNVITDPVANFVQIHFVRSRIVNYQHRMLIPFLDYIFATPEFATTLRRESLGVPREGPIQACSA